MKRLDFPGTKQRLRILNPVKDGIKQSIIDSDEDVPIDTKNRLFAENLAYIFEKIFENGLWVKLRPEFIQDGDMSLLIIFNTPDGLKTYYPVSNRYLDKEDFCNSIITPWKEVGVGSE